VVRYLMLVKYTETGVAQIQNTTRRAEWFRKWADQLGVTIVSIYWLVGEYDAVVTVTAKESAPIVALSAHMHRQGFVRTQLIRAYAEEEFQSILKLMPGFEGE
jgi:uncharacterized protein with GYD domain